MHIFGHSNATYRSSSVLWNIQLIDSVEQREKGIRQWEAACRISTELGL